MIANPLSAIRSALPLSVRHFAAQLLLLTGVALLSSCARQSLPPACAEKPSSGQCRAAIPRYWYDTDTATCKQFIWGGCGGNVPFETLEACQQSCNAEPASDAAPEMRSRRSY